MNKYCAPKGRQKVARGNRRSRAAPGPRYMDQFAPCWGRAEELFIASLQGALRLGYRYQRRRAARLLATLFRAFGAPLAN